MTIDSPAAQEGSSLLGLFHSLAPSYPQFSHSVMSDSATPCTATPHTSLSFTISQSLLKLMLIDFVMHPIISFSVVRFSFWLQSYPETGSFPMNLFFASGDQSTGASASVSVILISMQD